MCILHRLTQCFLNDFVLNNVGDMIKKHGTYKLFPLGLSVVTINLAKSIVISFFVSLKCAADVDKHEGFLQL